VSALPYHLEVWYPALVRTPARLQVVGAEAAPAVGEVALAWSQVRAGEALVLVDRPRGWRQRLARLGRRGRASRLSAELPGAGCSDRWIVLPGTGGSDVLLAADPRGLVASLRLLPAGRRRWRVLRAVLEVLGHLGLGDRLGLDEVVVTSKGDVHGAEVGWLAQVAGPRLGVSLGVPGLLRKVTALVSDRQGEPQGVVKLSIGPESAGQIRKEAEVLARLADIAPHATFGPELYDQGETARGVAWLAQEVLPGERSRDESGPSHASFLAGLHWRTGHLVPFRELAMFAEDSERLEQLRAGAPPAWSSALAGLRDALRERLEDTSVLCTMCHGDFTPWNLVTLEGRLRAFDWEFAREDAPALYDWVHFHVQTGVLVHRLAPGALLERIARTLEGPSGIGLLQNTGLSPRDLDHLVGLYLLHVSTLDEELVRRQDPGFAQVQWLREARIDLARTITVRVQDETRRRRVAPSS